MVDFVEAAKGQQQSQPLNAPTSTSTFDFASEAKKLQPPSRGLLGVIDASAGQGQQYRLEKAQQWLEPKIQELQQTGQYTPEQIDAIRDRLNTRINDLIPQPEGNGIFRGAADIGLRAASSGTRFIGDQVGAFSPAAGTFINRGAEAISGLESEKTRDDALTAQSRAAEGGILNEAYQTGRAMLESPGLTAADVGAPIMVAMAEGAAIGGVAGSVVPGLGNVVGTTAGLIMGLAYGMSGYGAGRNARYELYHDMPLEQLRSLPAVQEMVRSGMSEDEARQALVDGTWANVAGDVLQAGANMATGGYTARVFGRVGAGGLLRLQGAAMKRAALGSAEGALVQGTAGGVQQVGRNISTNAEQWYDNVSGAVIQGGLPGALLGGIGHARADGNAPSLNPLRRFSEASAADKQNFIQGIKSNVEARASSYILDGETPERAVARAIEDTRSGFNEASKNDAVSRWLFNGMEDVRRAYQQQGEAITERMRRTEEPESAPARPQVPDAEPVFNRQPEPEAEAAEPPVQDIKDSISAAAKEWQDWLQQTPEQRRQTVRAIEEDSAYAQREAQRGNAERDYDAALRQVRDREGNNQQQLLADMREAKNNADAILDYIDRNRENFDGSENATIIGGEATGAENATNIANSVAGGERPANTGGTAEQAAPARVAGPENGNSTPPQVPSAGPPRGRTPNRSTTEPATANTESATAGGRRVQRTSDSTGNQGQPANVAGSSEVQSRNAEIVTPDVASRLKKQVARLNAVDKVRLRSAIQKAEDSSRNINWEKLTVKRASDIESFLKKVEHRMYSQTASAMNTDGRSTVPGSIFSGENGERLRSLVDKGTVRLETGLSDNVNGYTTQDGNIVLNVKDKTPRQVQETLRHEATHAALQQRLGDKRWAAILYRTRGFIEGTERPPAFLSERIMDAKEALEKIPEYQKLNDSEKAEEVLARVIEGEYHTNSPIGKYIDKYLVGPAETYIREKYGIDIGPVSPTALRKEIGQALDDMIVRGPTPLRTRENLVAIRDSNALNASITANESLHPNLDYSRQAVRDVKGPVVNRMARLWKQIRSQTPPEYEGTQTHQDLMRTARGEGLRLKDVSTQGVMTRFVENFFDNTRAFFKHFDRNNTRDNLQQEFALSRSKTTAQMARIDRVWEREHTKLSKKIMQWQKQGKDIDHARIMALSDLQLLAKSALEGNKDLLVRYVNEEKRIASTIERLKGETDPEKVKEYQQALKDRQTQRGMRQRFEDFRNLDRVRDFDLIPEDQKAYVPDSRFVSGLTDAEARNALAEARAQYGNEIYDAVDQYSEALKSEGYQKQLDKAIRAGYFSKEEGARFKARPDYINQYEVQQSVGGDFASVSQASRITEGDRWGRRFSDGIIRSANAQLYNQSIALAKRTGMRSFDKKLLDHALDNKFNNRGQLRVVPERQASSAEQGGSIYSIRLSNKNQIENLRNRLRENNYTSEAIADIIPNERDQHIMIGLQMPKAGENDMASLAGGNMVAAGGLGSTLNALRKYIGYFSTIVTRGIPTFAPINYARDIPELVMNISSQKLGGIELSQPEALKIMTRTFANTKSAYGAAVRSLSEEQRGLPGIESVSRKLTKATLSEKPNTEMDRLVTALEKEGGFITKTSAVKRDINDSIRYLSKNTSLTGMGLRAVYNAINFHNEVFERAAKVALAKALKDSGYSERQISTALVNAMDFNRRGRYANIAAALYPFFTTRMTGAMSSYNNFVTSQGRLNKKGMANFASMIAGGIVLNTIARSIAPTDKDLGNYYDNLNNVGLTGSIPLWTGSGWAKIPVPYGVPRIAWVISNALTRGYNGAQSTTDTAEQIFTAFADEFSPAGAPRAADIRGHIGIYSLGLITPEVLHRPVNAIMGVNDWGESLNSPFLRNDRPLYTQPRQSTGSFGVEGARLIYQMTGGSVDMTPEQFLETVKMAIPFIDQMTTENGSIAAVGSGFTRLYKNSDPNKILIGRTYSDINDIQKAAAYISHKYGPIPGRSEGEDALRAYFTRNRIPKSFQQSWRAMQEFQSGLRQKKYKGENRNKLFREFLTRMANP